MFTFKSFHFEPADIVKTIPMKEDRAIDKLVILLIKLTAHIKNVDDTAPKITAPTGPAGDSSSEQTMNENISPVHTFQQTKQLHGL